VVDKAKTLGSRTPSQPLVHHECSMDSAGNPNSIERRRWIYSELFRMERHWTDQLQVQQARISSTMSVNGIMLAFVAGSGLVSYKNAHLPAKITLVLVVISLSVALVFGVIALFPRVPPGGSSSVHDDDKIAYFLSPKWMVDVGLNHPEDALLNDLSASLEDPNGNTPNAVKTVIDNRRRWIRLQLVVIGISAGLLVALVPLSVLPS
jgi:hypothetical protein